MWLNIGESDFQFERLFKAPLSYEVHKRTFLRKVDTK